jgi:hypothetical protein
MNNRKSTIYFIFYIGDTTFTWSLKKQSIVTLSICEVEYVATTTCVCYSIWLIILLKELRTPQEKLIEIYVNFPTIALEKNHMFHDRSTHIDTRFYCLQDCITNIALDITAALKILFTRKKNRFLASCSFKKNVLFEESPSSITVTRNLNWST